MASPARNHNAASRLSLGGAPKTFATDVAHAESNSRLIASSKPPRRLSVELFELCQTLEETELSMGELIDRLQGRVYTLLLVFLSLPFCQPIALPGVSTPFGVVIALLGLRFGLRKKPWLPQRVLEKRLSPRLRPALRAGSRVLAIIEKLLHPRMVELFDFRFTRFAAGAIIFFCGLLLLLPLPVPFSNFLPAITILLVAASFSARDGLLLGVGTATFLVTLAAFGAIFLGGAELLEWIRLRKPGT
jgi:hypothetical protein